MRGIHRLQPVVVVDEAHLLDREMLEEVRFLLNFKMDAESPMALILVGQSELWDRLQLQAYTAIRQRIDLQCKLTHYDRAEAEDYMKRHLTYAGATSDIFSNKPSTIFIVSPVVPPDLLTSYVRIASSTDRKTVIGLLMTGW